MNISGKTPLMRAKNLEKMLDVGEIYLKLEGANPSHHKYDRIAEVMVRDCIMKGYDTLLTDGALDYISAVLFFAARSEISVRIARFRGEKWKESTFSGEEFISFSNRPSEKAHLLDAYCRDHKIYNASNGYHNKNLSVIPLQKIGEEIVDRLGEEITTVFTQLSYGYTVSACTTDSCTNGFQVTSDDAEDLFLHHSQRKLHLRRLQKKLRTGGSGELQSLRQQIHPGSFHRRQLPTWRKPSAIYDTQGNLLSVDEALLKESVQLLKKQEKHSSFHRRRLPLRRLLQNGQGRQAGKRKACHRLKRRRSDLTMIRIRDFDTYRRDTLGSYIEEWLQNYKTPSKRPWMLWTHGVKDGYILLALRNNVPQGICLVVHTGFKDFIPTYHLAYIATKEGNKGRGIATTLISEMLERTGGNMSLHVDLPI